MTDLGQIMGWAQAPIEGAETTLSGETSLSLEHAVAVQLSAVDFRSILSQFLQTFALNIDPVLIS